MNRAQLVQLAIREAGRVRFRHGCSLEDAICPFDLAQRMGLTVQFMSIRSLEGMYAADTLTIVVGSERPAGRRRFTCGHEIGHHVFKHGTSLDQLGVAASSPQEFLADAFAGALLMPKLAIDASLSRRQWTHRPLTPAMVFTLSQELGVGYSTLLTQLNGTLRYLTAAQADALARVRLPELRRIIAGCEVERDVFPVDDGWGGRALDIEVGDIVRTIACASDVRLLHEGADGCLVAQRPGVGWLLLPSGRQIAVRVSRRQYAGRAIYRHEEDEDAETHSEKGSRA